MDPDDPAELGFVSYQMLPMAEHIEPTDDGYALLGREGLRAYDQDDEVQWEVETAGTPLTLGRTADLSALRTAIAGPEAIAFERIGQDGSVEDSVSVSDPKGPLDLPQVVLRDDGGAWVFGGEFPSFWQGQVLADGTLEIDRLELDERRAVLAATNDEAYALRVTWPSELVAEAEQLELQRLAPDGTVEWTTVVHDVSHDGSGAFEWGGTLGPDGRGGVFVVTVRSNDVDDPKTVTRQYSADGELLSDQTEPQTPQSSLRTLARPGGGSLWLEGVAGGKINVQLIDLSGEIEDEASFDGDGTPIVDATFIGDVLHVLSEGGLTRIYVPPVDVPPVG